MIKKIKHFIAVTPIGVDPRIRSILFEKGNNLKLKLDQLSDQSVVESLQWNYFEEKEKDFFEQTESINQQSQYTEGRGQLQLNVCKIFEILGLRKHYPGKISIQDVQSHINVLFEKPEDMTDVPWIFLREIIVVNCGFRESILGALHRTKDENKVKGNLLSNYRSQDTAKQTSFTTTKSVFPHPCDVLLAVYLCSDMNLQRILANKIASCQLAIPFIHPTFEDNSLVAMTWPLREIIIGGEGLSAFSSELPIVSFVRVGQCDFRSKSKLINEVLRDENEEHATFFHRDCSLGQLQRQISNGVIEVSWFVPSTKDKSSWSKVSKEKEQSGEGRNYPPSLSEPFVVLNLRGDAHDLVMQTTLLCQITDIFVVLIDSSNLCNSSLHHTLQGVHTSNSRVILVTNLPETGNISQVILKYENDTKMDVERTALISLYDCETKSYKNASEVKCLLTNEIADSLHLISERKGLETALDKTTVQIILDENDNSCRVGKELASSVFEVLMKPGSKANALPLQGEDLWQKLSKEEKERNRVGNLDLYDISEKRLKKINQIKEKQFDKCNSLHEFPLFIESLYRCHGDPLLSRFFLSWLKLFLDNCSRDRSRQKQEDFREALLRYQKARRKTTIKFENAEKEESNAKKLLEDAEKDLANASFGLEHCFREIGQVFEAIMNIQELKRVELREKSKIVCQHLPRIVAKLLLLGQPFELMDGDAANVPLKWIKAVFGELQNCIGNAKVFVVSVLGIQSSGKSTLLNSMFGLQFAVSAGRCTRGIYTQLLPLGNRKQDFGFDYIMIIDTEGLRAPELLERKVHHDNELATLVVGMADYTIINIKGETMADIENVLQIVVHALLRLKQANNNIHLKQSCVLVHQNVSAQDAEKQMQRGHHITIQNLDKITQEVAKTEHLSANYNSFSDVITFDASTCIKYVPDLWHGTPPMAPVNTKYSLKVKEIFDHLLQVASDKQKLTISHAIDNFECLWKGILKEDFVFSFRNNLEVKAYSLLESEYQCLIWRLEEAYLTCFNANVRPRLSKCDCENALEICAQTLTHEFIGTIQKVKTDVEKDIESFIEKSELNEQMIQWKENKLLGIQNLVSQMITSFEEKVRSIKLHNKIELSSSNLINEKEKEINDKAQILATSFRGENPSDAELKQAFEDMWKNWLKEIEKETPPVSHEHQKQLLSGDMKEAFRNDILLRRHNALLQKEVDFETFTQMKQNKYLTGSFQLLPDKHLSVHGNLNKVKGKVGKLFGVELKVRDEASHDLNHVLGKIDTYLRELYKQENECTSLEFKHILKILTQFYSRHNYKEGNYTFNNHLQIQLAVHVSRFVFSHFCEMNSRFYERRSVQFQLKQYKPKAFKIFNDRVSAKTNEIIASNIFWTELEDKIYENVMVNVAVTMKKRILSHFNFQKYHLTKQILEEICMNPDCRSYLQYIRDPEGFSRHRLENFMNAKVFDRYGSDTFYVWTENETLHIFSQISVVLRKLQKIQLGSMEILRKELVKEIGRYVSLKAQSFSHILEQNVGDIMSFNECVIGSSGEARSRIQQRFEDKDPRTVKWIEGSPFSDIFNTLWGCSKVCPFCGEPCQYSGLDHPVKHRCIQHRPTGLRGTSWRESGKLVIESCNFKVQSTHARHCGPWCGCTTEGCETYHPYKEYIKYVPEWDISPQPDMIGSTYWAWVMCKFHKEFAEYYGEDPPDIPESWLKITQQEAKESLSIFET
ncbi:hypothetical protein FSP39_004456 [Pinctada imbricata]|uniref:VLIG-type G domain-containing protein n=1 Tax=Pinctada imbricata TaxID=66713 RepID=A0AA89BQL2_PINIB|nr:hypothetical protein FSP39_004456 [Pinctada imbricata]